MLACDMRTTHTENLPVKVKAILQSELKQGALSEMERFKEALAAGYDSAVVMKDSFFKINARKVSSLIKSINNDLTNANHACLRYANDAYRKVIFQSEMFVSNGVYTEKQAIEKAIEDFTNRGLHCVEYKNGSMHDIADYADMAIKTASQRAQLMGEGEFRKKIGNPLVIISIHSGTCPLCAPWQGRVLIDDVYSGGTKEDGDYPLLSEAMAAGLFHPRCRHGTGTYYPEVADIWEDKNNKPIKYQDDSINQAKMDKETKKKQSDNQNLSAVKSTQNSSKETKLDIDLKSGIIELESKNTYGFDASCIGGSKNFTQHQQKHLQISEYYIRGNDYETAVLYDSKGRRTFSKVGSKNEVSFTKNEIKKMQNGVLTHNHPNETIHSPEDIAFMKNANLSEIRVCNKSKIYSIKRKSEKWNPEIHDKDSIKIEYNNAMNESGLKYRDIAAQEGKKFSDYLLKSEEEGLKNFCDKFDLDFEILEYDLI